MTEEKDEVIDETIEETQEEEVEEVEETQEEESTPTLEDYQRLLKENKTLKAQKEHFKKKATKSQETNKPNESSDLLAIQKEILDTKGYGEETIQQAERLAKQLNISILEAVKDPLIAKFAEAEAKEIKAKKAQLGAGAGGGSVRNPAFKEGMSEEEHRKAWAKSMGR